MRARKRWTNLKHFGSESLINSPEKYKLNEIRMIVGAVFNKGIKQSNLGEPSGYTLHHDLGLNEMVKRKADISLD